MLKVIGSETVKAYYLGLRMAQWFTRTSGIPAAEPNHIQLHRTHSGSRQFMLNDIESFQSAHQVLNFVDLTKSKGNYVCDADGNYFLDVCSTDLNPLGYNHQAFVKAIDSKAFDAAFINAGTTTNQACPQETGKIINESLIPLAPEGLESVVLTRGGQAAEKAILAAFAERGRANWTAIGFDGATHGNHTSLALSGFRGSPKLPHLNWPVLKYPKAGSESQTLDSILKAMKEGKDNNTPVGAVVIEPFQSTTGHQASEQFFSDLSSLAKDNQSALIVDATESGFTSNKHGVWGYEGKSDYLVFGKRTQIEGFFCKPTSAAAAITLGGDLLRLLQFQIINKVVDDDLLLVEANAVGQYANTSMQKLIGKSGITDVRSVGSQIFVDTQDSETANKLVQHLLHHGVLVRSNGGRGIAIKPSLVFRQKHASELVNVLTSF